MPNETPAFDDRAALYHGEHVSKASSAAKR
jgi:hypothetical protein